METIKRLFKRKWHAYNPMNLDGIEVYSLISLNPIEAFIYDVRFNGWRTAVENFKENMED